MSAQLTRRYTTVKVISNCKEKVVFPSQIDCKQTKRKRDVRFFAPNQIANAVKRRIVVEWFEASSRACSHASASMFRMRFAFTSRSGLHTFVRFTSGFVLLAKSATIGRQRSNLKVHIRAGHEKIPKCTASM
jgi:hypothetical protein